MIYTKNIEELAEVVAELTKQGLAFEVRQNSAGYWVVNITGY